MNYPKLNEIPTTRDLLDKFKGYNHNLRIGEGEFYDMQNLTGDDYPILSPRKKRGTAITTTNPNGMCSNTRFCYVDGQKLILRDTNGEEETYDLLLTGATKELISIGSNIIIMPDQKFINTVSTKERGNLLPGVYDVPAALPNSTLVPKIIMTWVAQDYDDSTKYRTVINKARGNKILIYPISTTLRYIPAYTTEELATNGVDENTCLVRDRQDMWMNPFVYDADGFQHSYQLRMAITSGTAPTYRYFTWKSSATHLYGSDNNWYEDPVLGIFALDDDQEYFENVLSKLTAGSFVIDGTGNPSVDNYKGMPGNGNKTAIIIDTETSDVGVERRGVVLTLQKSQKLWYDFYGLNEITKHAPIVIMSPIQIRTQNSENTETQNMPAMDFIVESSNRLWGCRYGTNNKGDFVNELYASELGNFKNWVAPTDGNAAISTSPYTVPVGTSGKFTGAVNYGGKPIFFKEDCMHRVFGDYPANYQVQTIMCKGVQEGCSKSLVIVNDVLYYKSRSGICAYDGSLPVEISQNFGDKQYSNAVGGTIGNKYYVSMKDIETDDYVLFVYDTIKRMWHKEDNTEVTQFCNHKGELYYIDRADRYIHTIKGTGVVETQPIKWGAETGILGATTPDDKYVTKIDIRMSVAKGSKMSLHIEYDSMGEWERLMEIEGLALNTFTIPVRPRRCDHFRLKFEGEGDAKIFSISKTLEETE